MAKKKKLNPLSGFNIVTTTPQPEPKAENPKTEPQKKAKVKKKPVTVYFPPEIHEQVRRVAFEMNEKQNTIYVNAIKEWLERRERK